MHRNYLSFPCSIFGLRLLEPLLERLYLLCLSLLLLWLVPEFVGVEAHGHCAGNVDLLTVIVFTVEWYSGE